MNSKSGSLLPQRQGASRAASKACCALQGSCGFGYNWVVDKRLKILIVDDDEAILKQIQWALAEEFHVFSAGDRQSALEIFRKEEIPVVLLDLGLPPKPQEAQEGLLALDEMIESNPYAKVIIISGNSERHNALAAVDKGAYDIFPKPIALDELKVVLKRVCKLIDLDRENLKERHRDRQSAFNTIIGSSPSMQEIFKTMRKVAGTRVPILISGENGTGKELIANAIHNLSSRRNGPFVVINCSAIPHTLIESELFGHEKGSFTGASTQRKGKLEYAHGGTLFLDEIGELVPELQVKILRFLQEKAIERVGGRQLIPVDCRIIAATNRDLEAEVKANRFREDLYFRIAIVKMALPPLRNRNSDVIHLAEYFITSFSKELKKPLKKLSKAAIEAICKHDWPGNVRELQNRVKRALVLTEGPSIGPTELGLGKYGDSGHARPALREAKEAFERDIVVNALRENNRNITKTAKALGISRPTLYDLISRYGL